MLRRWWILIVLAAVPCGFVDAAEPRTMALHREPAIDADSEAAAEAAGEETATDAAPEAAKPEKTASPAEERARAFKGKPLKFTSKGQMRALLFKMDRDLHITLEPVMEGESLTAVEAHVVDRANGDKTYEGRLEVTPRGTFKTDVPQLINAANLGNVDPLVRARLVAGEGPIVTHGQIETQGNLRIVEFTHSMVGEPAEDGSMQVETKTVSADGKVNLTTVTTLAPDGLPWMAQTTGIVKKGPVDVNVSIKLTREMSGSVD